MIAALPSHDGDHVAGMCNSGNWIEKRGIDPAEDRDIRGIADRAANPGTAFLCLRFRFELDDLFFRYNLAVEEVNLALSVTSKAGIVCHHADGGTLAVQIG